VSCLSARRGRDGSSGGCRSRSRGGRTGRGGSAGSDGGSGRGDSSGSSGVEYADDAVVRGLRLPVRVEEEGVRRCAPRVGVADTPDGNGDTCGGVDAGLYDVLVVSGRRAGDIELSDRNVDSGTREGSECALEAT
jgi:hypothetical protein